MNRAEYRRAKKDDKKRKTVTYNLTKSQLDQMICEELEIKMAEFKKKVVEEATKNAMNDVTTLMLALPLKVMKEKYWQKTYPKRIPEFVDAILEYYGMFEHGKLDIEELKKDLWEYGGVKFE